MAASMRLLLLVFIAIALCGHVKAIPLAAVEIDKGQSRIGGRLFTSPTGTKGESLWRRGEGDEDTKDLGQVTPEPEPFEPFELPPQGPQFRDSDEIPGTARRVAKSTPRGFRMRLRVLGGRFRELFGGGGKELRVIPDMAVV